MSVAEREKKLLFDGSFMENRPDGQIALSRLERALGFLRATGGETSDLSRLLLYAVDRTAVSYQEVKTVIQDEPEEVLLLAFDWKLLLPLTTAKSSSWEDRVLSLQDKELYEIPNIIKFLLMAASKTADWQAESAMYDFFKESGHPHYQRMPGVVMALFEEGNNNRITADRIKFICSRLALSYSVDSLIADLKAAGIMSPRLGSAPEVNREGSPIYDLNPAVKMGFILVDPE
jgi:hypothetical protein